MDKKETGMSGGCACPMCWGSHHWGHVLAKVLIVLFVFWCGVQFGELRGLLRSSFERGGYAPMMYGQYGEGAPNMMYTRTVSVPPPSTVSVQAAQLSLPATGVTIDAVKKSK